jgi:hypothetical protein
LRFNQMHGNTVNLENTVYGTVTNIIVNL